MDGSNDALFRRVSDYYADKVRRLGATAAGADWKDKEGQDTRFEQLAKITRGGKQGSFVEIGCGWGAFAAWARERGLEINYTGYDVCSEMIAAANDVFRGAPNVRFQQGSSPIETADYVVASGIFNVRFEYSDEDWNGYVDRTVDEMARAARIGFAFNCLTGFSDADRKEARLFYPFPGDMFDRCLRRHGRHAALLQDYGLYEFTILIWKSLSKSQGIPR